MHIKSSSKFIGLGLLLIGAALLITIYNFSISYIAEKKSQQALEELRKGIIIAAEEGTDKNTGDGQPLYKSYPDMDMPLLTIDGVSYIGILKIPSLSLELPIKGELSNEALYNAPCRYSGSVYKDNMIIAAHNYYSHFGSLARLMPGDEVSFTDGDGNEFLYTVSEQVQIDGTDVDGMKSGEWDMTLFTCTVSGTKRVTIRLDRVPVL